MYITFIHRTSSMVIIKVCLLLLIITIWGCKPKPQITGEVWDGFDQPLQDAIISVQGTTFKAATDEKGKYAVEYVPGKIKLVITKSGYTTAELDFDIAVEATLPAEKVVLYKIPPSKGIWLFGSSDYVLINQGEIESKRKNLGTMHYKDTYTAIGKFTQIAKGKKLRFFDNSGLDDIHLLFFRDSIFLIIEGEWMNESWKAFKIKDEFIISNQIAPGIIVREISTKLEGKCAFVGMQHYELLGTPRIKPKQVFLMEFINTERPSPPLNSW